MVAENFGVDIEALDADTRRELMEGLQQRACEVAMQVEAERALLGRMNHEGARGSALGEVKGRVHKGDKWIAAVVQNVDWGDEAALKWFLKNHDYARVPYVRKAMVQGFRAQGVPAERQVKWSKVYPDARRDGQSVRRDAGRGTRDACGTQGTRDACATQEGEESVRRDAGRGTRDACATQGTRDACATQGTRDACATQDIQEANGLR